MASRADALRPYGRVDASFMGRLLSFRRATLWRVAAPGRGADRGRGMAAKAAVRRRRRQPQLSAPGGSGLGLAIARSLVQAHGGEISVESQP